MKINSIRISNILSFEYKNDINQCPEILMESGLNIIIGPNGSGKSNFLEIITKLFHSTLFKKCEFIEKELKNENTRKTISIRGENFDLPTNNYSKQEEQVIQLKIGITDRDKNNLNFIHEHHDEIQELIQKYVNQDFVFPEITKNDILDSVETTFQFNKKGSSNEFLMESIENPIESFIFHYLQYFFILQNLIYLGNTIHDKGWPPLKDIFAMMGAYRNYNTVNTNFTINEYKQNYLQAIKLKFFNETTRSSTVDEPAIFEYVRTKIGYAYHELGHYEGRKTDFSKKLVDETFLGINKLLKDMMKLEIEIEQPNVNLTDGIVRFKNLKNLKNNEVVNIKDLSAGEKGIIHFIFAIHGYEINDGIMIIDEPELHLHPQIQEKYVTILKQASKIQQIQFLVATHSPVFVTPDTIEGVIRFYKNENGFTNTKKHSKITKDEKDKIQMLNYINSAKIFFSKKVVLVEGDSDHFFLQKYFQNYKSRNKIESTDIEFLNMGGADRYHKWYELLQNFKIKTYYIGDLDNILRENISNNSQNWKKLVGDKLLDEHQTKLMNDDKSEYEKMMIELSQKYSKNIFLLCNGSMEDYFERIKSIRGNSDRILNFCSNEFDSWRDNSNNMEIKNELDYFFHCIINSN